MGNTSSQKRDKKYKNGNIDMILFDSTKFEGMGKVPELSQIGIVDDNDKFQQLSNLTVMNCCKPASELQVYEMKLDKYMKRNSEIYIDQIDMLRKEMDRLPLRKCLETHGILDKKLYGIEKETDIYIVYKLFSAREFSGGKLDRSIWFDFECEEGYRKVYAYSLLHMKLDKNGRFIRVD